MKTEQLSEHFRVEYHPSGVLVYRVGNFTRQTIDMWLDFTEAQDKRAATENRPIATLMDVSLAGYPTPYLLKRTVDSMRNTPPNLEEYLGGLVNRHIFMDVFMSFMRHIPKKETAKIRLFRREEEPQALVWLAECLNRKI